MRTLKILVADRDDTIRAMLAARLDRSSIEVGDAATTEATLERVESLRPDVVFLDADIPGVAGPEATRRIMRCRPETRVIGMSERADTDTVRRMLGAGAIAFIAKQDVAMLARSAWLRRSTHASTMGADHDCA